jgi:hypothetical protein
MKKYLIVGCAALALCGCAYMKSNTHSVTRYEILNGTNHVQVVEQDTHSRAFTLFDANSSLTKFRNGSSDSTLGTNTIAPGTYASGINESASATNVVAVANALAAIATAVGSLVK